MAKKVHNLSRAERTEHANTEVQIRLLLELVDEMVKNSLPEWMAREAEAVEETGSCRDYDDFFNRTRYTVPEGVLDENGQMEVFNNDLVIRYLERVVVRDDSKSALALISTPVIHSLQARRWFSPVSLFLVRENF